MYGQIIYKKQNATKLEQNDFWIISNLARTNIGEQLSIYLKWSSMLHGIPCYNANITNSANYFYNVYWQFRPAYKHMTSTNH